MSFTLPAKNVNKNTVTPKHLTQNCPPDGCPFFKHSTANEYVSCVHQNVPFSDCLDAYYENSTNEDNVTNLFYNFSCFFSLFVNLLDGMVPMTLVSGLTKTKKGNALFWGLVSRGTVPFDVLLRWFLYGRYNVKTGMMMPSVHMMQLYWLLVRLLSDNADDLEKTKFFKKFVKFLVDNCNVSDLKNVLDDADADRVRGGRKVLDGLRKCDVVSIALLDLKRKLAPNFQHWRSRIINKQCFETSRRLLRPDSTKERS